MAGEEKFKRSIRVAFSQLDTSLAPGRHRVRRAATSVALTVLSTMCSPGTMLSFKTQAACQTAALPDYLRKVAFTRRSHSPLPGLVRLHPLRSLHICHARCRDIGGYFVSRGRPVDERGALPRDADLRACKSSLHQDRATEPRL